MNYLFWMWQDMKKFEEVCVILVNFEVVNDWDIEWDFFFLYFMLVMILQENSIFFNNDVEDLKEVILVVFF